MPSTWPTGSQRKKHPKYPDFDFFFKHQPKNICCVYQNKSFLSSHMLFWCPSYSTLLNDAYFFPGPILQNCCGQLVKRFLVVVLVRTLRKLKEIIDIDRRRRKLKEQCTIQNAQCTMHNAQCRVHHAQCTMCKEQGEMHNAPCTMSNAQYAIHNA